MEFLEDYAKTAPPPSVRAIQSAPKRTRAVRLASLWPRLVSGSFVIADYRLGREACDLMLRFRARGQRTPLQPEHARMMQDLLVGVAENSIAIDRDMSCSSVSLLARRCLRQLGVDCTMTRAPFPLAIVAAAHRVASLHYVGFWEPPRALHGDCIVRMARPDGALRARLTDAECKVAAAVVAGRPRRNIAADRGVSERTIANQLHSIFVKLAVSGRFELIRFAVAAWAPSPPARMCPERLGAGVRAIVTPDDEFLDNPRACVVATDGPTWSVGARRHLRVPARRPGVSPPESGRNVTGMSRDETSNFRQLTVDPAEIHCD